MSKVCCYHACTGCSQTHYGNVWPCGVFPAPVVGRQIEGLLLKSQVWTHVLDLSFISGHFHESVVVCGLRRNKRLQLNNK